jgi:hypothetical protein
MSWFGFDNKTILNFYDFVLETTIVWLDNSLPVRVFFSKGKGQLENAIVEMNRMRQHLKFLFS